LSETTEDAATHPWAGQERQKLQALMDLELVKLGIHIRKMNSPGSPVYRYGENIIPAGLILTSSFLATALIHFYVGAAVLAVRLENQTYILDNLLTEPLPDRFLRQYRPYYAVNAEARWVFVAPLP
jgi:hypothetical protein